MLKLIAHEEVLEIKVSRTILGRAVYYNSFFFVDGMLIDTGPAHLSREAAAALRTLPVEKAVITHRHEDHTGNCRMVQEKLNIPVFGHPLTLKAMSAPPAIQRYRKFLWGEAPPATAGIPLPESITTPRFKFKVIHTPGHSPDHVSFFEPERKWLFCGDLYLGERLNGFMQGEDIAAHLDSLKKVIRLQPRTLFCGLKGKVENAVERLSDKYSYWWDLGCQARTLYESGASPHQIRRKLLGGEVTLYYLSQRNWGRRHLVESLIAHRAVFTERDRGVPQAP